jgi:hypothetical protein
MIAKDTCKTIAWPQTENEYADIERETAASQQRMFTLRCRQKKSPRSKDAWRQSSTTQIDLWIDAIRIRGHAVLYMIARMHHATR